MIMKPLNSFILFSAVIVIGSSQRSPYAGRRPIGYPLIQTTTSANLGNRFGDNGQGTTQRLPIDALGDRELVNRLGQYPQDKQPFWLLNWQALEEYRKRQQTYNIRPSIFANNFIPEEMVRQNGQNLQQNLKSNEQVGQNLQPTSKPKEQSNQNLQQTSTPKEQFRQNFQ